jgi:drug/metabolite transporter (DMT)-like permease
VLSKVVLVDGADVLTMSAVRAVLGVAMLFAWLKLVPPAVAFVPRAKWISLGLGLLFAGNVFLLFTAIETVEVPIAILTYFVYPLLTGLAAAASGLEKITWRGAAAAIAAFLGLALMIGAHPTTLAAAGILAALGAALCRVVILLVTRALLSGADALRITWYSLVSSTVVFVIAALATWNWQPPATTSGWLALIALSAAVTTGLLGVFASTVRIGPHRAVHESRAVAHGHRQRALPRRGANAAAGARRRYHARGAGDVSAAPVKGFGGAKQATRPVRSTPHSHPLHEAIHHPLLARLVELDGELVAVDGGNVAVAEFLVEDAVADREVGDGAGGFGDELAFDGERKAWARLAADAPVHAPCLAPTRRRGRGVARTLG